MKRRTEEMPLLVPDNCIIFTTAAILLSPYRSSCIYYYLFAWKKQVQEGFGDNLCHFIVLGCFYLAVSPKD